MDIPPTSIMVSPPPPHLPASFVVALAAPPWPSKMSAVRVVDLSSIPAFTMDFSTGGVTPVT